jgi:hypothetical protein
VASDLHVGDSAFEHEPAHEALAHAEAAGDGVDVDELILGKQ